MAPNSPVPRIVGPPRPPRPPSSQPPKPDSGVAQRQGALHNLTTGLRADKGPHSATSRALMGWPRPHPDWNQGDMLAQRPLDQAGQLSWSDRFVRTRSSASIFRPANKCSAGSALSSARTQSFNSLARHGQRLTTVGTCARACMYVLAPGHGHASTERTENMRRLQSAPCTAQLPLSVRQHVLLPGRRESRGKRPSRGRCRFSWPRSLSLSRLAWLLPAPRLAGKNRETRSL